MTQPSHDLAPGALLANRYQIDGELGRGGMGVVFAATDTETDRGVAIKVLLFSADAQLRRARFMREARVASQLRHPNIVQVLDYARASDERPFLVMERVRGPSMAERFARPLPAPVATSVAIQVLKALGHVHAAGVVHRDIKPGNILLERTDAGRARVRLTDFGIARLMDADERDVTQLTTAGMLVGTPAYMSPEQAKGLALIGPAADLYAVGICLYTMLAGRLPFTGGALLVMASKVYEALPPPDNVGSWPAGLWEHVARLAATNPEDRPPFAADAIAALSPYASDDAYDDGVWDTLAGGGAGATGVVGAQSTYHTVVGDAPSGSHESAADAFHESRWRDVWGRQAAVAQLAVQAARVEHREPSITLVHGGAGHGSTSLLTTAARNLAEDGRFQTITADLSSRRAAAALRSALEGMLGSASDGPLRVLEKATEWLRQHGETDATEAAQLHAFLRPTSERPVEEGTDALPSQTSLFLRIVRRACERRPVLLLLDDLDRAGSDGAMLLERIQLELTYEPMPLFVVASAKSPDFVRQLDGNTQLAAAVTRVELGPISDEHIIDGIAIAYGASYEAARQHAERASGNPYFARLLAEGRDVTPAVGGHDDSRELPDLLQRVVKSQMDARLARLNDREAGEALLARLAILGPSAPTDLLESLASDVEADFDNTLDRLIAVELLSEEANGAAIAFSQQLVRDIVLDGMSTRRTRQLHRRAAELRTKAAEGRQVDTAAVGRHLAAAGDEDAARTWFLRALREADAASDARTVVECGTRVIEQLSPDDEDYGSCCVALARAQRWLGDVPGAVVFAKRASLATRPRDAAHGLELLADFAQEQSDNATWETTLAALETLAEVGDDEVRRALDRANLFLLNNKGRCADALALGERMLEDAERFGDEAYVRCRLMWSHFLSRRALGADSIRGAGDQAQRVERLPAVASDQAAEAKRMLLMHATLTGEPEKTARYARELVEIERRAGRWGRLARAYVDQALCSLIVGDAELCGRSLVDARARVWASVTDFDRARLELVDAVHPYAFGVGEADAERVARIALDADDRLARGVGSEWTKVESSWAHLCLAVDASRRGVWEEFLDEVELVREFPSAAVPPVVPETLVRAALLARVDPDTQRRLASAAERIVALARANWTDAAVHHLPRWAALDAEIAARQVTLG